MKKQEKEETKTKKENDKITPTTTVTTIAQPLPPTIHYFSIVLVLQS